ncbi:hypothetical protein GC194_03185 [bacterium]|nr:hypothetical protein [bacterium]
MMRFLYTALLIMLVFASNSCRQDPPPFGERTGDSLFFSGRFWTIKTFENSTMGPGPNYFSNHPNHLWVDSKDRLHLTIKQTNNKWYATEVVSTDTMGYGTYRFTIVGNLYDIPANITLGLFTWDNNTFYSDGNSEVDIEFSKWGDTASNQTLNYAVQPVAFGPVFAERHNNPQLENPALLNGESTHEFTWTPDSIVWNSYAGKEAKPEAKIAHWTFDKNHPSRVKNENGNQSKPILIPAPGNSTNTRLNFWVQTWQSAGPLDGQNYEIMVTNFEFNPL